GKLRFYRLVAAAQRVVGCVGDRWIVLAVIKPVRLRDRLFEPLMLGRGLVRGEGLDRLLAVNGHRHARTLIDPPKSTAGVHWAGIERGAWAVRGARRVPAGPPQPSGCARWPRPQPAKVTV